MGCWESVTRGDGCRAGGDLLFNMSRFRGGLEVALALLVRRIFSPPTCEEEEEEEEGK